MATPNPASTIRTMRSVLVASISTLRRQSQPLERLGHVLPARRAAFVHDQRIVDDVGEPDAPPAGQRMPRRRDQAPVHRKQMAIHQLRRRFVRRRHAERKLEGIEQGFLDLMFGSSAQPHMNLREGPMKAADGVDQHVRNQVLAGDDVHLLRPLWFAKQADQVRGPLEERLGMRQELLTLARQRRPPAQAAAFLVQLDAQSSFQRQQPAPQPLLRDEQRLGRRAQTSLAGQLHEGRHLVRRKRRPEFAAHGRTSRPS